EKLAPLHPAYSHAFEYLAQVRHVRGDYDAADAAFREAITRLRAVLHPKSPELGASLLGYGQMLLTEPPNAEATTVLQEARTIFIGLAADRGGGPAHPYLKERIASAVTLLARTQLRLGQVDDAEENLREADEKWLADEDPGTYYRGSVRRTLAMLL